MHNECGCDEPVCMYCTTLDNEERIIEFEDGSNRLIIELSEETATKLKRRVRAQDTTYNQAAEHAFHLFIAHPFL